jgi:hypothetical protein
MPAHRRTTLLRLSRALDQSPNRHLHARVSRRRSLQRRRRRNQATRLHQGIAVALKPAEHQDRAGQGDGPADGDVATNDLSPVRVRRLHWDGSREKNPQTQSWSADSEQPESLKNSRAKGTNRQEAGFFMRGRWRNFEP